MIKKVKLFVLVCVLGISFFSCSKDSDFKNSNSLNPNSSLYASRYPSIDNKEMDYSSPLIINDNFLVADNNNTSPLKTLDGTSWSAETTIPSPAGEIPATATFSFSSRSSGVFSIVSDIYSYSYNFTYTFGEGKGIVKFDEEAPEPFTVDGNKLTIDRGIFTRD